MNEGYENIDQIFRDELIDFTPEVPEGAWENIAAGIGSRNAARVIPLFWKIAAGIAVLLSTFSVGYILINKGHHTERQVAQDPRTTQQLTEDFDQESTANTTLSLQEEYISEPNHVSSSKQINENTPEAENNSQVIISEIQTSEASVIFNNNEPEVLSQTENIDNTENQELIAQIDRKEYLLENNISHSIKHQEYTPPAIEMITTSSLAKNLNDDRWMVGGQAGPQLTYRRITSDNLNAQDIDYFNYQDDAIFAYAGGVNVEYKAGRRFSIQSGVYYSKMGIEKGVETFQRVSAKEQFNPARPVAPGGSPIESASSNTQTVISVINASGNIETTNYDLNTYSSSSRDENNLMTNDNGTLEEINNAYQYYEMIEVPLIARYYLVDRKLNIHVLGGVSTNLLVAYPLYFDNGDLCPDAPTNFNKVNYSGTFGLGMGYLYKKQLRFSIEPQFKYFFNNIEQTNEAIVYPYSLGIMSGITYIF